MTQFDLFDHVAAAYAGAASGRLSNDRLYTIAADRAGVSNDQMKATAPIGRAGKHRSPAKRAIRWHQQTLAALGLLRKVPNHRGVWELTEKGRGRMRVIKPDAAVLAFSTDLGVAIWSNCLRVFDRWPSEIFCAISSPPYPLRRARAYGNPDGAEYIDFICRSLEPVVRQLVVGGNVVLNVGDVFEAGSPAKSTYIERLVLALEARLGLSLMNRIVWQSNKPPGPIQWASLKRVQLNEGYEFLLWFSNDPANCIADNRRILEPHTSRHAKLLSDGGERKARISGDGAHRIKQGAYGSPTKGRIPRNVFHVANTCSSQREYKRKARELGLQAHGAPMPLPLARKLVRFLTDVGQLCVDMFGGSMTVPLACELEGRAWAATENVFDYVRGAAERFRDRPGFDLALACDIPEQGK